MDRDRATTCRWGGATFGVGSVLLSAAIIAYVIIYGQPEAADPAVGVTLADRVLHLRSNWDFAQTMWRVEILGIALLVVAGFILQHQQNHQGNRVSPRVAWPLLSTGAGFLFLMHPLMLGGYPEALKAFESEPGLMAMLNGLAWFIFYFGTAVLFLGFAAVFALGPESNGGIPSWLGTTGVTLSLIGFVGMTAGLFGYSTMMILSPFGLLANLLAGYLGYSIWRAGTRGGS